MLTAPGKIVAPIVGVSFLITLCRLAERRLAGQPLRYVIIGAVGVHVATITAIVIAVMVNGPELYVAILVGAFVMSIFVWAMVGMVRQRLSAAKP